MFRWGKGEESSSCGREVYLFVPQRRVNRRSAAAAMQGAKQASRESDAKGMAGWASLGDTPQSDTPQRLRGRGATVWW